MIVNVNEIESLEWSQSISNFGEIVSDIQDIIQSVYLIISTRPGSVPIESDFGCGLFEWIDEPGANAAPKMARDIKYAISIWEKRVTVVNVTPTVSGNSIFFSIQLASVTERSNKKDNQSSFFAGIEVSEGVVYLVDQFNRRISTPYGFIIIN